MDKMSQLDDASSIASFEDIGAPKSADKMALIPKHHQQLVVSTVDKDAEPEEVPDVLYVVQYRNTAGRLVNTKTSDQPIDVAKDGGDQDADKKEKAVIEIVTKVTSSASSRRARRYNRRRVVVDSDSDYSSVSESESEDDDGNKHVTQVQKTEMIVHSKYLKNALSAVVSYYPDADFSCEKLIIPAPYHGLILHRDALSQYKHSQPACHSREFKDTTNKHIDILLDFIDRTYSEKIQEEEHRHNNSPPAATFAWYWMLFKPGEVFYVKRHQQWTPLVISRVRSITTTDNKVTQYSVEGWQLRFALGKIQRQMRSYTVHAFGGEQAIHSLPVIPARFLPRDHIQCPDGVSVTERQIQLGKLYWELVKKPAHKEYDDLLIPRDNMPVSRVAGRVIVDAEGIERHGNPEGFFRPPPPPMRGPPGHGNPPPPPRDQLPQFSPRCGCPACFGQTREETHPLANFEDLDPKTADAPKNDLYYWVLSKDIPAFILGERRWGHLLVSGLKDVKADREAFKYLVLDDEIKLTVKALIGKFASADGVVSPWPRDLVKNKGEGRIFLLHGSPGVGKTCTAECVAELTHRPLLSLTSGDISTDMSAASVERNLNYFLTLGERYGALVLLDEADVYLEERRTKDLHRNGLVSIFLRALEYYRGVLFLTTNRVEAFDAAFTSRIHVALHYRKLSDEDRLRIWNNNFERLERDSGGKVYVGMSTREFAYESEEVRVLRWNGREIRNALQTAVALAETEAMDDGCEKVNVTDKHLRAVVKMSRGFKEFLRRRGWETEDSESEDSEYDGESTELVDD